MPRIPVRVEPYSSPSRQHRHYKNKRDQVLRALGKAAYINGSHFAIMWVSARGDVETYASDALQSRLDAWFVQGGIADEAKQLVKSAGGGSGGDVKVFEDSEEEGDEEEGDEEGDDVNVFLDEIKEGDGEGRKGKRGPLAPLNTAIANQHFLRSRAPWSTNATTAADDAFAAPKSAPLFPTTFTDEPPRASTPLAPRPSLSTPTLPPLATPPTVEITLANQAARTAFLELRFGQLQQGVCKTVAKAWIKIIEPKKQMRCPYNKGEAGKPDWWPAGVRHKEPDHLMKPERHALLLTILRSPRVKVARLQLATAEVVALIKADKVSLLMDVYRIAREEERLREGGEGGEDREVRVGVSTLDGWCREGSEPTSQGRQIARSATPEAAAGDKRKRSAAMVKSSSTSSVVHKRRSIATTTEVAPKPHHPTRAKARNSFATTHSTHHHQHQQQQLYGLGLMAPTPALPSGSAAAGMARSHSFSAAPSFDRSTLDAGTAGAAGAAGSCCSADTSPWPPSAPYFTEVNGLVTPLTATSSIDPSFAHDLAAAPPPHAGFYYAAPPPPPAPAAPAGPGAASFGYDASLGMPMQPAQVFEPNALGLDTWSFGQFDLSDLSSSSSWSHGAGGTAAVAGEASFSLDSIEGVPRTPSPGPPRAADAQARLRLELAKHDVLAHQHEQLHPSLHAAEAYWLPPPPPPPATAAADGRQMDHH
ncbi:uncharacterized protein SRS1_14622 [Sporisorium reilianum f. sp. reilianum]|uniref:Subtelomeric hrmA-associated cluster protein AFUB-079030/YDR124W-like helical bundle domain-containing protein n=1 Tax=Sporisorium reilianum f. sp. reilianum TaxID=72559 RepID=A0A2N8UGN9_9BASI|nr:uncharacterized protein SRS1_14622 [Sporisorium reilianum f. sp. reilianum]